MTQTRVHKRSADQKHDAYTEPDEKQTTDTKADLKASMDDLLDEIDGVLEENAEQFVKAYVQKGGE